MGVPLTPPPPGFSIPVTSPPPPPPLFIGRTDAGTIAQDPQLLRVLIRNPTTGQYLSVPAYRDNYGRLLPIPENQLPANRDASLFRDTPPNPNNNYVADVPNAVLFGAVGFLVLLILTKKEKSVALKLG